MKPELLSALGAFCRVAELRNISAAARQLDVSPSALSQTIRRLEKQLQVRLFERTTRSLSLTEAGQRYFERVQPVLAELAAATDDLRTEAGVPGGTLRVTLGRSTAAVLIEPLLARWVAAYPHITLDLDYNDGLIDIVREGFDAGIRLGENVAQDVVAVRLTDAFRLGVYASPGFLARHPAPQRPADLLALPCINYRLQTAGNAYKWELMDEGRVSAWAVTGPLIVNDSRAALEACAQGIGVALSEQEFAAPWVARGELVELLRAHVATFPGFYLYYPSRQQLPAKTRVWVDFLKRELRPQPP